ncbi:MAG: hypothetical protein RBG13Loki_0607 [Promethearchaeota archaeon CR_4]|nr:MAG: hypothetical protein RBG13Loki_0607 [Candidatus Lokiarchaeota archaeon CR_4]
MPHNKHLYRIAPENLGKVLYRKVFYTDPEPTTIPCKYCGTPCHVPAENYAYIRLLGIPVVCTAACLEQHEHVPVQRPVTVTWES